MFNFLKKKGKEKSNFFDNKVVSTPKSSKIFRKFVQSDMGQSSSLDKSTNKKTLKKSDSKDEEYNTAPNSPEVEKNNFIADSFLAIDDDSDLGSSNYLLQNNRAQTKPDTSSPSTSHDVKAALTPKPSVLLKSTPDAFYTKKTNNNENKRDTKTQTTHGSHNGSCSSKSFDDSELNNNFQTANSNRRNSDSNKQENLNCTNPNNTSKLSKQYSVDSIQSNTRNSSQQTNGFFIKKNKDDNKIAFDNESFQTNVTGDSKTPSDYKPDRNGFVFSNNPLNNAFVNKTNRALEEIKSKSIAESSDRRESLDSVSESASIVVKSRNIPVYNKVVDGNDSDTSLDSYSITASFEIKEALPDCGEKENLKHNTNGENNENVTYIDRPESITIDTEYQVERTPEKQVENYKNIVLETEKNKSNEKDAQEHNYENYLQNNLRFSLESKTDKPNIGSVTETEDKSLINKSIPVENYDDDTTSIDLGPIENSNENLIEKSLDSSMCLSGKTEESNNEQQTDLEQSTEEPDYKLSKTIGDNGTIPSNNLSHEQKVYPETDKRDISNVELRRKDTTVCSEPEQSKPKIEEEHSKREEVTKESDSEEDESEEDEEEKVEEELILELPTVVDVTQMDTELTINKTKPKVKKFVRFALIHNTYHGSDTSESEDEEEDEEEESEEEEEEEDDDDDDKSEDLMDKVLSNKMEEDKSDISISQSTPEDTVQPADIVDAVNPVEIVQESNVINLENVEFRISEVNTEPQDDP